MLGLQLNVRQPVAMTWPLTHRDSGAVNQAAARGPYNTTLLLTVVNRNCVKMSELERSSSFPLVIYTRRRQITRCDGAKE